MNAPSLDAPTREELRKAIAFVRQGMGRSLPDRFLVGLAELAARQLVLEEAAGSLYIDQVPST